MLNYKNIIKRLYHNRSYRTTLITCSIFPELAKIWWYFAKKYINHGLVRTVIADSSGKMSSRDFEGACVIQIPNYHHGKKMDIFINHIVQTPYVLFCDDDMFIIDSKLEEIGYNLLKKPRSAVYSFNPRPMKVRIKEKPVKLIGGSCIMLTKDIIKKSHISLEEIKCKLPYRTNIPFHLFDTGDYLSYMLPKKEYKIYFRKKYEKPHLIYPFVEGVSVAYNWYNIIKNDPVRLNNILNYKESEIMYAYKGFFGRYIITKIYRMLFHKKPCLTRIITKKDFAKLLGFLKANPIIYKKVLDEIIYTENNLLKFIKSYTQTKNY